MSWLLIDSVWVYEPSRYWKLPAWFDPSSLHSLAASRITSETTFEASPHLQAPSSTWFHWSNTQWYCSNPSDWPPQPRSGLNWWLTQLGVKQGAVGTISAPPGWSTCCGNLRIILVWDRCRGHEVWDWPMVWTHRPRGVLPFQKQLFFVYRFLFAKTSTVFFRTNQSPPKASCPDGLVTVSHF